jgi:hypothetical protein
MRLEGFDLLLLLALCQDCHLLIICLLPKGLDKLRLVMIFFHSFDQAGSRVILLRLKVVSLDELSAVGDVRGFEDFLIRRIKLAIENVFGKCVIENDWLLHDE